MFSEKGSRDNMSVVLVSLPGAPKVTEEALKKEEDLDKYLESRVEELLGRFGDEGVPDLVSVLRCNGHGDRAQPPTWWRPGQQTECNRGHVQQAEPIQGRGRGEFIRL
ncbi:unnamed protein product, partial [Gadus morhua 'NCC']